MYVSCHVKHPLPAQQHGTHGFGKAQVDQNILDGEDTSFEVLFYQNPYVQK